MTPQRVTPTTAAVLLSGQPHTEEQGGSPTVVVIRLLRNRGGCNEVHLDCRKGTVKTFLSIAVHMCSQKTPNQQHQAKLLHGEVSAMPSS
jgi:hypothetical protein